MLGKEKALRKVYVIGLGPGALDMMTFAARAALDECDVIAGYTTYIDLIEPLLEGRPVIATGMMREIDRCKAALECAAAGQTTAMVCSGDSGVYGMASPLLELAPQFPDVEIEVVPGISAAQSGSAVLGAPLSHDFATISLSDLLTPWELIEQRLDAAASADFCMVLYNPRSKKRADHLRNAVQVIMRHKSPETMCGWVRNIGRADQSSGVLPLVQLADFEADMFTTVFIGNAHTYLRDGRLVTPRGYRSKKRFEEASSPAGTATAGEEAAEGDAASASDEAGEHD